MTDEKPTKLIHVKVIDGSQADIYEIATAFKKLSDFDSNLPFKLQAIITNDHIELQDVDAMIKELYRLKKQIDTERKYGND